MSPFAQGNIAAARREIARCVEALKSATTAKSADEWRLIGRALGHAAQAQAQLDDALVLEEMAVTTGEEAAE